MDNSFIVYLKNKTSLRFEYKSDVAQVVNTEAGYHVTFNNGKSYHYGTEKVRYYPLLSSREDVRIYENGKLNKAYNAVDNYGRYLVFRSKETRSAPVGYNSSIEICDIKKNIGKAASVISYFKEILKASNGNVSFNTIKEETTGENPNQISTEILLKALDKVDLSESRSALSNYIDGLNPAAGTSTETLIYPFGCNESQKLAVETTLSNSISIVEGPPGTGKTQTILNIVANLIVQNKIVAIVSNNNAAVFNVREKLEKYGYGMVVASLGSNDNKTSFFNALEEQTINPDFELPPEQLNALKNEVRNLDSVLTKCFQYRNKLAALKTKLSDTEIEFSHVKAEQPLKSDIIAVLNKKPLRKWGLDKVLKLKDLLLSAHGNGVISFINKLRLVFEYGLLDLNSIRLYSDEFPVYLNYKFYELYIEKIKTEITETENWLADNNEEANLKLFTKLSKKVFNGVLFEKYNRLNHIAFDATNYRDQLEDFINRYPVVLSSTLSLHTSIPKENLFDYLIIDESSQVDIIKSAVCFSCCRNVVIVGDSMQLPHIVDKQSQCAADQLRASHNISPAYDYVKQNILNSLKSLYRHKIKSVLLKEHYRCHPIIIGFCNKKYYDNKLVIMTRAESYPFKIIETNIAGGNDNYNQRQIDETDFYIRNNYAADFTKVAVIAPYRQHADILQKQLPHGVEADTIHKFQGREKDTIIFNTVRGKIGAFIDDPNLINVAVSRAVKEFIVVKPASMELPHGTNIGDMIRYIHYTTDPDKSVIKGSICSVFDILYKEYSNIFEVFLLSNKNTTGSAAEVIIHNLLTEKILTNKADFSTIDVVREYRLRDLVRDFEPFSVDEIKFINSNSRIDFLLYSKIDKTPVLAIEVDGMAFHGNELQKERDSRKDHILEILGVQVLRLATNGNQEETKIIKNLKAAMGYADKEINK